MLVSSPQVCYAKELKEGFVEYTEQVVKLMVPLLKFYFHDDILSGGSDTQNVKEGGPDTVSVMCSLN